MTTDFSVEITAQAYSDLEEILHWYAIQKDGLEKEFVLSFEAALSRLQRNPLAYQVIYKQARSIFLQRFPYKIIYKINGKAIKIYSVSHHSRNPRLLKRRLKWK